MKGQVSSTKHNWNTVVTCKQQQLKIITISDKYKTKAEEKMHNLVQHNKYESYHGNSAVHWLLGACLNSYRSDSDNDHITNYVNISKRNSCDYPTKARNQGPSPPIEKKIW